MVVSAERVKLKCLEERWAHQTEPFLIHLRNAPPQSQIGKILHLAVCLDHPASDGAVVGCSTLPHQCKQWVKE